MLPQNENQEKITAQELWGLLFPACACHVDAERSHFIRRTSGNNLAHAIVATNETAEWVKAHSASEHLHIQRINEDGLQKLSYSTDRRPQKSQSPSPHKARRFTSTNHDS